MKTATMGLLLCILLVILACTVVEPPEEFPAGNEPATFSDTTAFTRPSYGSGDIYSTESAIETAAAAGGAGYVVVIHNGTYTDFTISIDGNGASENPLVVMAETPGQVFLQGRSTITVGGNYVILEGIVFQNGYPADTDGAIIIEGDHDRVTNCKIYFYNKVSTPNTYETKWLSLANGTQYGEVDHCHFEGKRDKSTLLTVWRDSTAANYHKIHHNVFKNFADPTAFVSSADLNGWETIRIGTSTYSQSASYTTVEYNYFYKCNGEIEMISNKSGHNTYRYNTFINNAGHLTLRHGNSCTVYRNFFRTGGVLNGGGIRVMDKDHTISENYVEGARFDSGTKYRGGIALTAHYNDPKLNAYWKVTNVTISKNTIINSMYSFNYGAGSSTGDAGDTNDGDGTLHAPDYVTFTDNLVRNDIDGDGAYQIITVWYSRNVQHPTYSGNVYYGSALGISPKPTGISTAKPDLALNSYGQYLVNSGSQGAPALYPLSESDVGTSY